MSDDPKRTAQDEADEREPHEPSEGSPGEGSDQGQRDGEEVKPPPSQDR